MGTELGQKLGSRPGSQQRFKSLNIFLTCRKESPVRGYSVESCSAFGIKRMLREALAFGRPLYAIHDCRVCALEHWHPLAPQLPRRNRFLLLTSSKVKRISWGGRKRSGWRVRPDPAAEGLERRDVSGLRTKSQASGGHCVFRRVSGSLR